MTSSNNFNSSRATAVGSRALPLLYQKPVVLRFADHKHKRVTPPGDYGFAAGTNAVPLMLNEFMPAVRNFPIVFADAELPVAIHGLKQGQNLFLEQDNTWWAGAYIPAYLRRYPFILLDATEHKTRLLMIDAASARFTEALDSDLGQKLFTDEGTATPTAAQMLKFCEAYHQQHLQTVEFVRALDAAELLVSKKADMEFPDKSKYQLSGFRIVDPDRYRTLPPETLVSWQTKGWLDAIALHVASLQNWGLLLERNRDFALREAA